MAKTWVAIHLDEVITNLKIYLNLSEIFENTRDTFHQSLAKSPQPNNVLKNIVNFFSWDGQHKFLLSKFGIKNFLLSTLLHTLGTDHMKQD